MKTIAHALSILFFLMNYHHSHAQILGKLSQKLEEKIKERINAKSDKTTPQKNAPKTTTTKNSNGTTTTTSETQIDGGEGKAASDIMGKLGEKMNKMMDFDVKPQANYVFKSSVTNKMTVINSKETQVMYMKILMNKEQSSIGMTFLDQNNVVQQEKGMIITDVVQKAFFTFTTDKKGKKQYFGMRIKEEGLEEMKDQDKTKTSPQKQFSPLVKTGKTKIIMGITCDGYLTEGEKGEKITFWAAPKNSLAGLADYTDAMKKNSTSKPRIGKNDSSQTALSNSMEEFIKQGKAILGQDIVQKNGDQMISELHKIQMTDPSAFSTVEYASALGQ